MKAFCGIFQSSCIYNFSSKIIFIILILFSFSSEADVNICQDLFGKWQRQELIVQSETLAGADSDPNKQSYKIGTYNLRHFSISNQNELPHLIKRKARAIADFILSENLDIIGAQELWSVQDGVEFAKKYLRDQFVFMTSSKERDRVVGFWIRKSLPFDYVEVESHYNLTSPGINLNGTDKIFSSDIPTAHFYKKGSREPVLSIVVTHLKAARSSRDLAKDADRIDHIRKTQVQSLLQVARDYYEEFGPNHRLIVLGDFNIRNHDHTELADLLYRSGLLIEASVAHPYVHLNYLEASTILVDGALVSPYLARDVTSTRLYSKVVDDEGVKPSDHDPIIIKINLIPD